MITSPLLYLFNKRKWKIKMYTEARALLNDNKADLMCIALRCTANIDTLDVFNYFPELNKHKPKELYIFSVAGIWFPHTYEGRQKRIEILSQCIKELEK